MRIVNTVAVINQAIEVITNVAVTKVDAHMFMHIVTNTVDIDISIDVISKHE